MNRIVWVIGQSAAGKATFMENAAEHPNSALMQQLGYHESKIIPLKESLHFDDDERPKMIGLVLDLINRETNAVILIKWQHPDTGCDIIGKLRDVTADTPNEFVVLSVDSDVLYARLTHKPWWTTPDDASVAQEQMNHLVEVMRNNIRKYLRTGLRLAAEIDATDGYRIVQDSLLQASD